MPKKLDDTPGRISRRKYEEANKEERKQKHKDFHAMLYRDECEEIENYCTKRGFAKADFLRYAFELVLMENREYEQYEHFNQIRKNHLTDN